MAKRRKIFSSYLVTFPNYSLHTFQKNAGSGQVRSPELVCRPHLRKVCNHVRAIVFHGAISSLLKLITVPVCTISISQNLHICDLRSGQTVRVVTFIITSLWENNEMYPASSKQVKNTQFIHDYYSLSICNDPGGIY